MKIDVDISKFPKIINNDDIEKTLQYLLQIGYNQVYINESSNLYNKLEKIINNNGTMINVNENLNKLFGLSSSSSKKGEISEMVIYEYIKNNYKNYCYEIKREIAHNADGELNSPSGLKALVEIKNYETNINNDEVNKFKYDLQFNNIYFGLFISIKSGIIGKKYIDYESYIHNDKEYHIVYITKIYQDITRFDASMLLLEKIYEISKCENKNIKTLIHNNLDKHFEELNLLITKTSCLKDNFKVMEDSFKNGLNQFYLQLREYDYDIKDQVKKIMLNIEEDISKTYINEEDNKEEILSLYKKDKCFLLFNKLFDIMKEYQIIVDEKKFNIVKDKKIIGSIKKLKDKLNLELEDSVKISLTNKNIDKNILLLEKILNSYI